MSTPPGLSGLLVVDKPTGCTSHDVVDRVRRIFGMSKVGHSGTLDPAATGVLLVGLGKATRLLGFLQAMPKQYRAVARFGISTSSQDAGGEIVAERPCELEPGQIEAAAQRFRGEITQLVPMVSAVKVGGERLYKAARRGEDVLRPQRTVRVYALNIESFDPVTQSATIFVHCSSGTYVRTLASDLGDELHCGAHLTGLRRLGIGSFTEAEAVDLQELEAMGGREASGRILSLKAAMRDFPQHTVTDQQLEDVSHGKELLHVHEPPVRAKELPMMPVNRSGDRPAHQAGMTAGIPVGILSPQGELIAVYRRSSRGLRPEAVLI